RALASCGNGQSAGDIGREIADEAGMILRRLGFRVGNSSAIGWHQRANFPASLLPVGVTPTTSRRIATRSLRRKMARKPSRAGGRRTRFSHRKGQKPSPRRDSFFYSDTAPWWFLAAFHKKRRACAQGGNPMPKHDPPGDDAALLELEHELIELDRAIRAAEENREAID